MMDRGKPQPSPKGKLKISITQKKEKEEKKEIFFAHLDIDQLVSYYGV